MCAHFLNGRSVELLSLQWRDVDEQRNRLAIRAEKAKDNDTRWLPISQRLKAVLAMVRNDPDGQPHTPDAYVFGNVIGHAVADTKKAWLATCARAGITDLHFHDLRREAASRFLEAGWPLHHVQEMLGHADLKQTSTYLNVTQAGLQESMAAYTGGIALPSVAIEATQEPQPNRYDVPGNKTTTVN